MIDFREKDMSERSSALALAFLYALAGIITRNGSVFVTALFFFAVAVVLFFSAQKDRKFLAVLFMIAFLVRVGSAYLIHVHSYKAGFEGFISGDDRLHTLKAIKLASQWMHVPYNTLCDGSGEVHGVNPFTYLLAVLFRFFEPNYFASKMINCLIGSLSPLFVYLLARLLFSSRIAKTAFAISCFYPSNVMWSLSNLRDPAIVLLTLVILYLIIGSAGSRNYRGAKFFGIVVMLYFLKNLQIIIFLAFMGAFAAYLLYRIFKILGIKLTGIFVCVFYIIYSIFDYASMIKPIIIKYIMIMINRTVALVVTGESGYSIYDSNVINHIRMSIVSLRDMVTMYIKGISYFLFSPFPWVPLSGNQLVSLPQVVAWYFLIIFAFLGFFQGLKSSLRKNIFILIFLIVGISIFSIGEGNIGTAFRHRDNFSLIVLIYSAAGLVSFFCKEDEASKTDGRHI